MPPANPFVLRGPVRDPKDFFGRRREVRQASELFASGQSVSIVGPRRIGKTSLLYHLADAAVAARHGLEPDGRCIVWLDCAGWRRLGQDQIYALLLEELRETLAASGRSGALPAQSDDAATYRDLDRAVRAVARAGLALLCVLDEFDALSANPQLDADFFSGLRALATRHGVAYLTASIKPLLVLTYASASALSSPFFNFFAQLRLYPFSADEADELLTGLAARASGRFSASMKTFLTELAGTHPLLLQIAGYHAFDLGLADGSELDGTRQHELRGRFLAEAEAHWEYWWRGLAPRDQRLLALLPLNGPEDPEGVQRLQHDGLAVRRGGTPVPLSPAFGAWVARQEAPGLHQAPPVILDPAERLALLRGRPLSLTPTEFTLLTCLVERAGQVVTHQELEARLWPDLYVEDPERLKTTVKTVRRALGDDADRIQNVRGLGYRFAPSSS